MCGRAFSPRFLYMYVFLQTAVILKEMLKSYVHIYSPSPPVIPSLHSQGGQMHV